MHAYVPRRAILLGAPLLGAERAWGQSLPVPGERAIGRPDAPVTVIEFHSMTCGNCARFHNEVFLRIKTEFIEPGLVRFALRDFPLDRVALEAAAMVHCAGPDRFEALVTLVYQQKEAWAHAPQPRDHLRRFSQLAGVSAERLEACWADPVFLRPILEMRLAAEREHGVNSTPSFLINGRLHRGVLTFEQFSALVRPLLPPRARPS